MRFVVCGEALIDLAPIASENTFRSTWAALSAGGPMNTAVGLARLGDPVEFCGRLSTDQFGEQLRSHLRSNGVGLELATVCDDPTSLAVVSLDEQQRASYSFHFHHTANFGWKASELPQLKESDWMHIASLATVIEPGAPVLLDWADRHTGALSLDINVRPTVIPDITEYWNRVEPWLTMLGRHRAVVKASDEDIELLAAASGVLSNAEVAAGAVAATEVMARWEDHFGFAVAVVTLGPDGAWARRSGEQPIRVPGRSVEIVDTVGAGDTFMAGFADAYAAGRPLEEALTQGVDASAYVCTRQGPQPPTRAELADFLCE